MHGLIFETSIWLLAGSTRFVHHHWAKHRHDNKAKPDVLIPIVQRAGVAPHARLGHQARACYGQFSKCHVCFCGLDPGNLKIETIRTNKQYICF